MDITQLYTWDMLRNVAGMAAAVVLITQFTKGTVDIIYDKICALLKYPSNGFPTRPWVAVVSEVVILLTLYFNGEIVDGKSLWLALVNGLALATVAILSYTGAETILIGRPKLPAAEPEITAEDTPQNL